MRFIRSCIKPIMLFSITPGRNFTATTIKMPPVAAPRTMARVLFVDEFFFRFHCVYLFLPL